ncbi:hypothetical protein JO84_gp364 [Aureococcus anophagefferens virus]|uniref:Uncharacterized protein n=1 Tax=Aureococcus anophagefferens virus TaxID=1474867 RepID=A0A076FFE3_9VIRU|nr:hypothetical protein JO84_gp364 [Aureococcus anophagefferens virus]AII16959.1 hypothetical protein AaV_108 [Aureococcus anophagefferens virus]UOG94407.1 hypothetical protein MKD35_372 [Aureococcus anophagefferens virus]
MFKNIKVVLIVLLVAISLYLAIEYCLIKTTRKCKDKKKDCKKPYKITKETGKVTGHVINDVKLSNCGLKK